MSDNHLEQELADLKEELSKLEDTTDIETEHPELYERMQALWVKMGGQETLRYGF